MCDIYAITKSVIIIYLLCYCVIESSIDNKERIKLKQYNTTNPNEAS